MFDDMDQEYRQTRHKEIAGGKLLDDLEIALRRAREIKRDLVALGYDTGILEETICAALIEA